MSNGFFKVPTPENEPVRSYAVGTKDREDLLNTYRAMYNQEPIETPLYIGDQLIYTDDRRPMTSPQDHKKVLGYQSFGNKEHVTRAIDAALAARSKWASTPWEQRAAIFLKAADLLAGAYRMKMNAATMLGQSKNAFQAEIDSACELIDFLRYNVAYAQQIYNDQPGNQPGVWNRVEYRPLEGFVFALTPFNFTAIAGNLPTSAAMMGNVVVWKPANTQCYSANVIMEILREAGLPDGVINLIPVDGAVIGDVVFKHPAFAGIHFTGSTSVFKGIWKEIGNNIDIYKSYPRIVGETGGKDFVLAHPSANPDEVVTALSRGAFEFQGQKCSAASRAYIPESMWSKVQDRLIEDVKSFKMGSPEDFGNFINAVIDKKSFTKIKEYIDYIGTQSDAKILVGGKCDDSVGYFIEPTVVLTTNPKFRTMCEEIFGPVLTIYVYKDAEWSDILKLVDETSEYALTGAILSRDRYAIEEATNALVHAAGNFYINDKPTGAVVGQQPFGGGRASGTNDKAGSYLNLLRWVSPRTIKETFVTPRDYRYPFLG
jgi:1-pyrroline-5-carboxylate dehydrogenase